MYNRQSIERWLYEELYGINNICNQSSIEAFQHLLASATLVDFPQFRDIHHLVPQVLDTRVNYLATPGFDYQGDYIKDSDKWEIYVEYRKILSRFLIDRTRSEIQDDPHFFSVNFLHWSRGGQEHYVGLAKYLLCFLSECHW